MSTAVQFEADRDTTQLPLILRGALILGVIEAVVVLAISLVNRNIDAFMVNRAISAVLLLVGAGFVFFYPAHLTKPKTIEGISGAAGVGLGATVVFLIIDVILLQNIGTYTNRWLQVGGFSNWWYHPVWWMVGTFMPWMGAWIIANQFAKKGVTSIVQAYVLLLICTAIIGSLAVVGHFPGAAFVLPTYGVAMLPGSVLANVISSLGAARR